MVILIRLNLYQNGHAHKAASASSAVAPPPAPPSSRASRTGRGGVIMHHGHHPAQNPANWIGGGGGGAEPGFEAANGGGVPVGADDTTDTSPGPMAMRARDKPSSWQATGHPLVGQPFLHRRFFKSLKSGLEAKLKRNAGYHNQTAQCRQVGRVRGGIWFVRDSAVTL
jgi:hypothetical protein